TENPSFEVISALLSRCQVYILQPLQKQDLIAMTDRAIKMDELLKTRKIQVTSYDALLYFSGGDGRKLYNCIELIAHQFALDEEIDINDEMVARVIQQNLTNYDKGGEMHYDIISAFIKSIRASDPNAAVYYLARMLEGGEDPIFICRRMVILAAEDIGLANPNALLMANTCFQSVHQIGMPEGRIIMSNTTIYLAGSPKSNTAYVAIESALAHVRKNGDLPIPLHLRNAPTKLMKDIGYGSGYQYAHDFQPGTSDMECLPEEIKGTSFYKAGGNPQEQKIAEYLRQIWKTKYGY
ncbi:MAG: replication-associated recombination protein A, partial [Saprospiraceae bacterium]